MGSIGQTFFGGSDQNQSSSSQSSGNTQSLNLTLPYLAQILGPAAGYVTGGGNMMASLLGIPNYTPTSAATPAPAPASTAPATPQHSYRYVDLKHDGINGNAKSASKAGRPISYWTDETGKVYLTNPASAPQTPPSLHLPGFANGGVLPVGGREGVDQNILSINGEPRARVSANETLAVVPRTPAFIANHPLLAQRRAGVVPPPGSYISGVNDSGMGPAIKPTTAAPVPTPSVPIVNSPATVTPPVQGADSTASDALTNFSNSAGLKFLQDQGNQMLNNNQAAKGMLQSGATLKGVEDYANGLNSTYLNQYLDHLLGFGQLGLGAAGILSDAGRYSAGSESSNSSGSGSSSSKPGILPGMQQAAAHAAAAGA